MCVGLIVYPLFFLLAESINVGDPQTFPPRDIGVDNFIDLSLGLTVLLNTAYVAIAATVMAIIPTILVYIILSDRVIDGMTAGTFK